VEATGAGWIVPKKYVERVGDDGYKKAPVAAGPYRFVSFTPGLEVTLEAFGQYWRKTPSPAASPTRSSADNASMLRMLRSGPVKDHAAAAARTRARQYARIICGALLLIGFLHGRRNVQELTRSGDVVGPIAFGASVERRVAERVFPIPALIFTGHKIAVSELCRRTKGSLQLSPAAFAFARNSHREARSD
jgi:hypothetical protein